MKGIGNQYETECKIRKLDIKALIIGALGLLVLIVFPIIVTQYNLWFDFSNTGEIGDTIGGLTAPVIGFFSALLIYLSFRAQIIANMKIQKQIDDQNNEEEKKKDFNYQMEIYKEVKKSFEQFHYQRFNEDLFTGSLAICHFISDFTRNKTMIYSESNISFAGILKLIEILVSKIEISNSKGYDIALILTLIDHQFNQYIWGLNKGVIQKRIDSKYSGEATSISIKILDFENRIALLRKA